MGGTCAREERSLVQVSWFAERRICNEGFHIQEKVVQNLIAIFVEPLRFTKKHTHEPIFESSIWYQPV